MTKSISTTPTRIKLHSSDSSLELNYADGSTAIFSAEFLRVHSPSAEVRGHGRGQEVLQYGKKRVRIARIEKSGRYALQLFFDDEHSTGIYSWDYFKELWSQHDSYWQDYLETLRLAGKSRDPEEQVVKFVDL